MHAVDPASGHGESFRLMQLAGFAVLVCGTLFYNEIVRCPCDKRAKTSDPLLRAAEHGWTVVSDQLYSSLVGFTQAESESGSILRNTPEGQGLEARRKLAQRWPSSQARSRVTDKEALMACQSVPDEKLGKAVEDWEVKKKEWQQKQGSAKASAPAKASPAAAPAGPNRTELRVLIASCLH